MDVAHGAEVARPDVASRSASWVSFAGGLGALLVPKCALCFAAYGSALSTLGLGPAVHQRFVEPLVALSVVASVALVLVLSVRRRDVITPAAAAVGAAVVLAGRYALDRPLVTAAGAVLLVTASRVNAARCRNARLRVP